MNNSELLKSKMCEGLMQYTPSGMNRFIFRPQQYNRSSLYTTSCNVRLGPVFFKTSYFFDSYIYFRCLMKKLYIICNRRLFVPLRLHRREGKNSATIRLFFLFLISFLLHYFDSYEFVDPQKYGVVDSIRVELSDKLK